MYHSLISIVSIGICLTQLELEVLILCLNVLNQFKVIVNRVTPLRLRT